MATLSSKVVSKIFQAMLPWSAVHANEGKMIPLEDHVFHLAGYTGIFQKGDIVFTYTKEENSNEVYPAIYVVQHIVEQPEEKGFQIYWRLVLLGGYGFPVIALYYQHPLGGNPHIYMENYFKDYGHGKLPKLNYYVYRVVAGGKTVWDVEDRMRG